MKITDQYLHTIKKNLLFSTLCILILVVLLLVATWWFIRDIQEVRNAGGLHPTHHVMQDPGYIPDITTVAPWMTFEYINVVFKLPATYLKDTLTITDTRYPKIEIERYARLHKLNKIDVLHKVQNALAAYKK